MTSLKGKHALVVGGSGGLGCAVVKALAAGGCHVTTTALPTDEVEALQHRFNPNFPGVD